MEFRPLMAAIPLEKGVKGITLGVNQSSEMDTIPPRVTTRPRKANIQINTSLFDFSCIEDVQRILDQHHQPEDLKGEVILLFIVPCVIICLI